MIISALCQRVLKDGTCGKEAHYRVRTTYNGIEVVVRLCGMCYYETEEARI